MKKVFNLLLIAVLSILTAFSMVACSDQDFGGKDKKGISGSLVEECVYEIRHYYAEDGVTTLDIGALELPSGATEIRIKKNAFKDNTTLKSIIVPATVTEIEAGAFAKMHALEVLEIPFVGRFANSDVYFKESAAAEKKAVDAERTIAHLFGTEEYDNGSSVTIKYGGTNGEGSTTCYIPVTLNKIIVNAGAEYSIPMYAFNGMVIGMIELKGNIVAIGEKAFAGAGYANITIPATVKTIYKNAFDGALVQKVIFENNASDIVVMANAFANCKNLRKVGVGEVDNNVIDLSVFKEIGKDAFNTANQIKYSVLNAGSFDLQNIFGEVYSNVTKA